jgi:predicted flap endonuclease-1-like 5' DNA nuclease
MPMPGVPALSVPEWCRVTIHRFVGGHKVSFTAVEYWVENYTTAGKDSDAPNAMWRRRSRGQIAKCAEAQALRKAFPELGSQPTADEVVVDLGDGGDGGSVAALPAPAFAVARKAKPAEDAVEVVRPARQEAATPAPAKAPAATAPPKAAAAPVADPGASIVGLGEVAYLRNKANAAGVDLASVLADMGGLVLEQLTKADFALVKARLQDAA